MPRRHSGRPGSSALLAPILATAALPALAQTPSATLPPVTVTAPILALTVPTNDQQAENFRQTPGNVSVVPAATWRDQAGVTNIRDMLEYTPGVFAMPKWGEDSRLSIRGSGLARNFHLRGVRLMQDGLSLLQADGSGDFQEIDPLAYQRLEVLRGGNAFAYGGNTLGGAINFVTPTGRDMPGLTLRAEAGSWGFARSQIAYGIARDAFDAWAGFTAQTQEGYRHHSAGRAYRLNGNTAYRWNEQAETRLYVTYQNIWQQIPGSVTRDQALTNPRAAASANLAGNYQRNIESTRIGTITSFRPQEGVLIEIGGGIVLRELDHPIFQYIDNRTRDVNLFARGTLDFTIAGLANRTILGINFAYGTTDNRRYVNLGGRPGAPTYDSYDQARTADAYLENSLYILPDLAVITGISAGAAWRASQDRFLSDGDQSGSGSWTWINPRIGLLWNATPRIQGFANVTWSTEPPTLSDLIALVPQGGFSLLKPQRAVTYEIGTRGGAGPFTWEAALYRAEIRDEIQLFTQGNGTSLAVNADRTMHQGIEAALTWLIRRFLFTADDRLTLRQAYTFGDYRFDKDRQYGNNQLPGAPRHLYRAELRYSHPAGGWIAPTLDWIPQAFYVDNANTLKTDAYALVGLRAGWDFANGLSAFVDARNLADTRTIGSASVAPRATPASALFEPGFGRSIYGGIQARF